MPEIIPERVLNRSTIATGTADPGPRRGVIRLSAQGGKPMELADGRVYRVRLAVGEPGTSGFRSGEFTISSAAGVYAPGADLNIRPPRDMKDYVNARFEVVRDPALPILLSDVLIITCAVVLMIALQYLVFKTKFGTAMRALSFSTTTAPLMGINVNRVIAITFVVGTSLAAVAAFLYLLKYPNNLKQSADQVWVLLGLKAFVAAVVGGIGNVRGAVLGGFLIALIEQLGVLYGDKLLLALGARPGLGTSLGDVYVFSVLILVLLLRPNGLLGKAVREKV
jgi:branched-subunit amino acid ABC-type transport system permease component